MRVELIGLRLPAVEGPTDLARLIVEAARKQAGGLRDGDIIVVTSKLYLKAAGRLVDVSRVRPSAVSRLVALVAGRDPAEVELVLRAGCDVVAVVPLRGEAEALARLSPDPGAARRLLERRPSLILVRTRQGLLALDGGLDFSNLPPGTAVVSDVDFDEAARRLRREIERLSGRRVGVVLADTEAPLGRLCTIDVAVGASGVRVVTRGFGSPDLYGRPKFGGVDCVADELAAAAALLMGQAAEGVPVVIVRGLGHLVTGADEGVREVAPRPRAGTLLRALLATLAARLLVALARLLRLPPCRAP